MDKPLSSSLLLTTRLPVGRFCLPVFPSSKPGMFSYIAYLSSWVSGLIYNYAESKKHSRQCIFLFLEKATTEAIKNDELVY